MSQALPTAGISSSGVVDKCPYSERAYAAGRAFVQGIDPILPRIAARAAEAEALGRTPDASMSDLIDAGVFRALTPRRWGGLEMDPASFMEGVMKIGSACGSTGWVAGLVSVHSWQIALFPEELQAEFWKKGPDVRASSSYAPTGRIKSVEGGFLLSGTWGFSSGIDYSDWVILGGVIRDTEDGPEARSFIVPKEDFTIDQGSWDVVGLKGSGSKSITLDGVFVPDYRSHKIQDVYERKDPGLAVNEGALYRLPWLSIFYSSISAAAIGAATGGLNAFVEETKTRVSAISGTTVTGNPFMHLRLANALGDVDCVRERTLAFWRRNFDALCRGEELSRLECVRSRFDFADATATSYGALSHVYETAGGGAIQTAKPMQRFLRDLMAMRNHPTATRELFASLYVQVLLDMPLPPFDKSSMSSLAVYG